MRVLFCTTGGAGHLLPLRPLAQALRAQGHSVAWATAPDAQHFLDGQGFEFWAIGPSFEASRSRFREVFPGVAGLDGEALSAFTFPRLFGAVLAPAMLNGLERAVRQWRPDCVVHEAAALAAPLVCVQQGLRHVAHAYGLRPPAEYLAAAMKWFGPHWQAHGLRTPQDGRLFEHLYLDVVPAGLQPSMAAPDERVWRFNAYRPAAPGAAPLTAMLADELASPSARRPCIYLSFGTVFNRSPALHVAAQAAARLGGTLVVTVGADGDTAALAGLRGRVRVHRFIDQRALLPHCDAVVSHGGAGTLLGGAAHGLPQLLLPQAADHFRNARALCAAGAGAAVEPGGQTVDAVEAALRGLLATPGATACAQRLAREMAALPDADAVARQLERWLARRAAS